MSWNNKVVWSEGMFLRPHHFQQHVRYTESFIEGRCAILRSYAWGFKELTLDQQLLELGKVGISSARGVFPDGTPFNIPNDDEPPSPLDIPKDTHELVVYLALPTRRSGTIEVGNSEDKEGIARYQLSEYEVQDTSSLAGGVASVNIGKLRMSLLLGSDRLDDYTRMGIGRIVERKVDKKVILDELFLPPALDCQAVSGLAAFLKELQALMHHRGEALAGRISESGRGGSAEIADFLLLQAVNRYEPLLAHIAALRGLHPEDFYRLAIEMAGELSTFTAKSKRPTEFPPYRHDNLQETFAPVAHALRQSLSMVLEQTAISIPLQERKFGIRVATVTDRSLFDSASFVLAVSANMPTEELRRHFPAQVKIGPVEQIRQLVNVQLPGIRVRPVPVAPRQIPYNSGFVYFELDRANDLWKQLKTSGGFAIHVGGQFPGIEMEFWAIKG